MSEMKIEKFGLDKDNPQISELPLMIREKMYNDIKEMLLEVEEHFDEVGRENAIAIKSEEWPITYMFSPNDPRVIVLLTIYKEDLSNHDSVLALNVNKNDMDKLLEE